jgi:hypothetical protein
MKKMTWATIGALASVVFSPFVSMAQDPGLPGDIGALQTTLNTVYNTMIQKCGALIGVASAIAGFAAIWYIGTRVWGHI